MLYINKKLKFGRGRLLASLVRSGRSVFLSQARYIRSSPLELIPSLHLSLSPFLLFLQFALAYKGLHSYCKNGESERWSDGMSSSGELRM